jgi:hypothetical protein
MNKNPTEYKKDMFKNFVQIGVVVADIDQATHNLSEIFGIGPFHIVEWPPAERSDIIKFYYSKPADFTARMAFTNLGPVELELIQPVSGKSIWADFLQEKGGGIHHIRFNVDDVGLVREYLSDFDIFPAQHGTGIRPGTTWINFASEEKIGFMIEVMNALPGTSGRTPKIVDGMIVG